MKPRMDSTAVLSYTPIDRSISDSQSLTRPLSSSKSLQASYSQFLAGGASASSSRPFLNMMNPMSRTYQGYSQANQSLAEEEDDGENENENDSNEDAPEQDRGSDMQRIERARGKRGVSWDAGGSRMNVLRPNIHQQDKSYEQDSSDDEVPQSFMIEASARNNARSRQQAKGKRREKTRIKSPLSSPTKKKAPILPSTLADIPLSVPPRPSELDVDEPPLQSRSSEPPELRSPKPTRGLDAYERALWNWVNVCNLDAFLQEVYYYYEGKGIYSIALARGLNLL